MTFTEQDYAVIREGCKKSAEVIVPLVTSYIWPSPAYPTSVIDVGCGEGWFLDYFKQQGITKLVGVDEHWPMQGSLLMDMVYFQADLRTEILPLGTGRFDLATCLEVAEHLPESRAETFISELCQLANYVLFGAAIPGQGGHEHINEQWLSYWASLFEVNGFYPCWDLRLVIWDAVDVEPWYRQNTVMFSNSEPGFSVPDLVHPDIFTWRVEEARRRR